MFRDFVYAGYLRRTDGKHGHGPGLDLRATGITHLFHIDLNHHESIKDKLRYEWCIGTGEGQANQPCSSQDWPTLLVAVVAQTQQQLDT